MSQQRRSTLDLIRELEAEAADGSTVALAVGFENTTLFIFSDAEDKLKTLNEMINEGGEPIGFLKFHSSDERQVMSIACRLLEEYAAEPWAEDYLERLIYRVVSLLDR